MLNSILRPRFLQIPGIWHWKLLQSLQTIYTFVIYEAVILGEAPMLSHSLYQEWECCAAIVVLWYAKGVASLQCQQCDRRMQVQLSVHNKTNTWSCSSMLLLPSQSEVQAFAMHESSWQRLKNWSVKRQQLLQLV